MIRDFLPRAFRRPVSEELQRQFVDRVHAKLDEKYTFLDAMTYGYKAILSSPHFLLLNEPGGAPQADGNDYQSTRLDDYALASRLSYFLWSTLPDDELLEAARKGELHQPQVLRAQVERMLNAPRAHRFTDNFAGQWLDLRKIDATIPDPQLYGDFGGAQLLQRSRQWFDIVQLALQTDSTRVISLWLGSQERPEIDGVTLAHHDASHHGQEPTKLEQLALIEEAELRVFGEFLAKMQQTTEGDRSLLDVTTVFYASNLGNSSSHDNNNLPIVLAGGGYKHQGHVAFDRKNNTLLSNLFVRMMQQTGIEAESFGASTGVVSEV